MTLLFEYPTRTQVKHVVPKTKIYQQVGASTALKAKFVAQIQQIIWQAKLSPETINLPATDAVQEIQVFCITQKTDVIQDDLLKAIDRAIPSPIIFELEHAGKIQLAAAYKRPSEADSEKWVISEYLRSGWLPSDVSRTPLPVFLNLEVLYDQMLSVLMPMVPQTKAPLSVRVERVSAIRAKEREINRLQSHLKRETQFNIKMTLHSELREAQADLEHLKKSV